MRDEAVLRHQRQAMFHEMGQNDPDRLAAMDAAFAPWLREHLANGHYIGLLAEAADGTVAAGAGVWLLEWPPTYLEPKRPRAYLLNVYTEPEHRRRGLARELVRAALEVCRERGIHLILLHASAAGRDLYSGLGFKDSNEMRLFLDDGP